jgi:hypothetical protein
MERLINTLNCKYGVHQVLNCFFTNNSFTINNFYYLKNHKFPNDVKLVEQNPYYGSLSLLVAKGKVYFVILKYVPSKVVNTDILCLL